jgi:hypothetical protein
MKKILITAVAAICILSSYGAAALTYKENSNTQIQTITTAESFSQIRIKPESDGYLTIEMNDVSTYIMTPGKPVLPKIVKIFELPFGVT